MRRRVSWATALESIATNEDVIAAFAYRISHGVDHALVAAHDDASAWGAAAEAVTKVGWFAPDDVHVRTRLGDAQTFCYVRSGYHAVVVVLPPNSAFSRSVYRACRRVLTLMNKEAT